MTPELLTHLPEWAREIASRNGHYIVPTTAETDRLLTELAEAHRALDARWMPISTAPKDGRWVMLFYDIDLIPRFALWDDERQLWLGAGLQVVDNPTHWQLLPEPPQG